MRSAVASAQYGRRCRLYSHYFDIGIMLLQSSADARQRSAGAHTSHEYVHIAFSLLPYLHPRSVVVSLRVGWVYKLLQYDAARSSVAQFFGSLYGARHSLLARR